VLLAGCATAVDDPGLITRPDSGRDTTPPGDIAIVEDTAMIEDTGSPSESDSGPCGLRINELQTGDGTTGGTADYVEVFNSCSASKSLADHKLVYRSSAGTTDIVVFTFTGSIAGRGYLIIGGSGYSGSKDGVLSSGLSVGGAGVGLRDASDALIDSVGYGSATNALIEGAAAPAPGDVTPAKSIARKPNGADSDNNSSDFTVSDPTPGAPN